MRLIDADEFPTKHVNTGEDDYDIGFDDGIQMMLDEIKDAKTIDATPVVYGYWIKASGMMPPEYFGRHVCSICDAFAPNEFHGAHEWLSPICPTCGAKMAE